MPVRNMLGVAPEFRREWVEFNRLLNAAALGDMVIVCTPAVVASSEAVVDAAILANARYDSVIDVTLETAAGDVHSWFNGSFAVAGSEVTAGNGTADPVAATVTLVEGRGQVIFRYIGAWAAADTATLTVTGDTIFGAVVANATSVDTLVA